MRAKLGAVVLVGGLLATGGCGLEGVVTAEPSHIAVDTPPTAPPKADQSESALPTAPALPGRPPVPIRIDTGSGSALGQVEASATIGSVVEVRILVRPLGGSTIREVELEIRPSQRAGFSIGGLEPPCDVGTLVPSEAGCELILRFEGPPSAGIVDQKLTISGVDDLGARAEGTVTLRGWSSAWTIGPRLGFAEWAFDSSSDVGTFDGSVAYVHDVALTGEPYPDADEYSYRRLNLTRGKWTDTVRMAGRGASLTASGRWVYLVYSARECRWGPAIRVNRARGARDAWTAPRCLDPSSRSADWDGPGALAASGSNAVVGLASDGRKVRVAISHDHGRTWAVRVVGRLPGGMSGGVPDVAAAGDLVVAAVRDGASVIHVWISTDGGRTWALDAGVSGGSGDGLRPCIGGIAVEVQLPGEAEPRTRVLSPGGAWIVVDLPESLRLVAIASDERLTAVGPVEAPARGMAVYESNDMGMSWSAPDLLPLGVSRLRILQWQGTSVDHGVAVAELHDDRETVVLLTRAPTP